MEVKKKRFFALSRIERATKLLICLFVFLLINCSTVFANVQNNFEYVIDEILNMPTIKEKSNYQTALNTMADYDNLFVGKFISYSNGNPYLTTYYFYPTNTKYIYQPNNYNRIYFPGKTGNVQIRIDHLNGNNTSLLIYESTSTAQFQNVTDSNREIIYTNIDIYNQNGDLAFPANKTYKEPYFIMSANKVGTTTVNNTEINCYYTTSFPRWSNSYSTNREIGSLYIDKNYILEDIFYPAIYINKYNWEQTEEWNYTGYEFFKEGEYNGYLKYSINIDNTILTAPYFYNINLKSVDKNLSEDLNINFAIINENSTGTGGTITNNSGDIISGDATKDKTTIGDILNTITEPYNPDKNILNTMNSGEILDNMGYQTTEDPNKDLWDTIINGLKEVLTGSGEQFLTFKFRSKTFNISSNDIMQPNSSLKVFTSLFVNFWLLMQMFTFIKKTIDQINEGNLKVMHDVDADCYFF